jgi:predicted transcriptional regulator YdeE
MHEDDGSDMPRFYFAVNGYRWLTFDEAVYAAFTVRGDVPHIEKETLDEQGEYVKVAAYVYREDRGYWLFAPRETVLTDHSQTAKVKA